MRKIKFISSCGAVDSNPPYLLSKKIPLEFKQMPLFIGDNEQFKKMDYHKFLDMVGTDQQQDLLNDLSLYTYRACPAFRESLKSIIVVPLPCEAFLRIFSDGTYKWFGSGQDFFVRTHAIEQRPNYRTDQLQLKFETGIHINCDPNMGLLFHHPHFHNEHRFETVTGILKTKLSTGLNVNTFWPLPSEGYEDYKLEAGTPLSYITPMIEEDFVVETEIVSQEFIDKKRKSIYYRTKFKGVPSYNDK